MLSIEIPLQRAESVSCALATGLLDGGCIDDAAIHERSASPAGGRLPQPPALQRFGLILVVVKLRSDMPEKTSFVHVVLSESVDGLSNWVEGHTGLPLRGPEG